VFRSSDFLVEETIGTIYPLGGSIVGMLAHVDATEIGA